MKPTPRLFVIGAALAAGAFAVSSDRPLQAANTNAVQVVNTPLPVKATPDSLTHTRRAASQHVTLQSWSVDPSGDNITFRNYGDPADTGDDPYGYKIPAGAEPLFKPYIENGVPRMALAPAGPSSSVIP